MKRYYLSGSFSCYWEEARYLYNKAMSLRNIGRVAEFHEVLKEVFLQIPASEYIGDLKKMAIRTWSFMSEEARKPYRDQYSQIVFGMIPSDISRRVL
eukprot:4842264-Karenia_brevis.AAC.1